ncbi:MAG: ribulose-phosphate 3-epimerase [Bacteriovoracaceae bacterium]|nr:ribulose-phosphate 3-epimerase [Bacteriovoracaceae bacterium]
MIIAPSLLAADFLNLQQELKRFDGINNLWLHLDIMDGHFVPNLTFGHPVVELLSKMAKHPLDAHFMVTNPEFYIDTFKDYKIHNFTFHYEVFENNLPELHRLIQKAKTLYPSVGLSIKPHTDVSVLSDEILKALDLVLVMSVEPGFGGQKFMPQSLYKVKMLKLKKEQLALKFSIQIDGGINEQTAKEAIEAGAENLVAGSAIFKHSFENTASAIKNLIS